MFLLANCIRRNLYSEKRRNEEIFFWIPDSLFRIPRLNFSEYRHIIFLNTVTFLYTGDILFLITKFCFLITVYLFLGIPKYFFWVPETVLRIQFFNPPIFSFYRNHFSDYRFFITLPHRQTLFRVPSHYFF